MTMHSAEIRDIVAKQLEGVAEVTVTDQPKSTIVHVRFLVSTAKLDRTITIVHGLGYGATARQWAQGLRKEIHPAQ